MKNIKTIGYDVVLNIIATMLPIFILQFIILPLIAKEVVEDTYGLIVTLISLITLLVQSVSISLSNTRLLLNQKYNEEEVKGDFNLILIIYLLLNLIFIIIGTIFYEDVVNLNSIILMVVLSVLQIIRNYFIVAFRLKIDYKRILYNNIVLSIGYLIGLGFFYATGIWQIIYIAGEVLSLVYVVNKSDIAKEPIKRTIFFKGTLKLTLIILLSSFLGTAITYIDKLLLYPILGADIVAIYFVATLFGKTVSMVIGPINNVVLTYISKMDKFKEKSFELILIIVGTIGILAYVFIMIITEPMLNLLYPTYVEEAMKIAYLTTLTAIITMIGSVLNPFIMKFRNIKWQIWINTINIIVYFVMALLLVNKFGIYGFCISALIASIVKVVIIVLIFKNYKFKTVKQNIDKNTLIEKDTVN